MATHRRFPSPQQAEHCLAGFVDCARLPPASRRRHQLFTGNLHVSVVVDSEIAVERGDNQEVTGVGKATDEAIILKPVAVGMSATMIELGTELKFTKTETLDVRFAVAYELRAAAMAPNEERAEIPEQLELHRLGKPYRGPDGE